MNKTKLIGIALLLSVAISVFAQSADEIKVSEKQSLVEQVTSWYMDNMNYGTITLLMTVESSFIPFPSEIVVPPAAYKASQENSEMNIIFVVIFATIGAILGSLLNYYIARWLGRPIIYRFAESRLGRMCMLSAVKVQKAEDYFIKHGNISTFIGRLVVGIRQLISLPAGLARMPLLPFLLFTTLGAGTWNIILAIMGYIAHGQASLINQYSKEISYVMLILGVFFMLYLLYNGFIKKNKK